MLTQSSIIVLDEEVEACRQGFAPVSAAKAVFGNPIEFATAYHAFRAFSSTLTFRLFASAIASAIDAPRAPSRGTSRAALAEFAFQAATPKV